MSREIIKDYFLLNIYLISNLGKFRAMQLWIWPSKLSFRAVILIKSEFQNRFWIIFDFILSFFQSLFKRWVNNKLKLDESSLLHIFYYILYFTVILSLAKRFEMMVTAAFRKNLGPPVPKQNDDSCLPKTKNSSQHALFRVLSNWCGEQATFYCT